MESTVKKRWKMRWKANSAFHVIFHRSSPLLSKCRFVAYTENVPVVFCVPINCSFEPFGSCFRMPAVILLSDFCHNYCYNSLMSGSPKHPLGKLQNVNSSAARLAKHEHIQSLLQKLHWLPVASKTQYKISTLYCSSFAEYYPVCLSELLTDPSTQLRSISDTATFRIPLTNTKTFG